MRHIYEFGDSPCCMKVRMMMLEKGLDYERRFVNSWSFDHYQLEYQQINPLSLVPTLVDEDGTTVIQSNVIVEYLEQRYPNPPLLPKDAALAAQAREWMAAEQDYLFPAIVTLSFNIMMKIRVQVFGVEQMTRWSKIFSDQEKAQDYLSRVTAAVDDIAVAQAEKKVDFHFGRLESQLGRHQGTWICGEQFTAADICLAGIMDRLEYLDRSALYEKYKGISGWFAAIKQRDSFKLGVHDFAERMWGPLKSPEAHPYCRRPEHIWGYWKDEIKKV